MAGWRRFYCTDCGAEFEKPIYSAWHDRSLGDTTVDSRCPKCYRKSVEEMKMCPVPGCGGWVTAEHHVCEKCRLRVRGDFSRFMRKLTPEEQMELDDMLDGVSVREFAR